MLLPNISNNIFQIEDLLNLYIKMKPQTYNSNIINHDLKELSFLVIFLQT